MRKARTGLALLALVLGIAGTAWADESNNALTSTAASATVTLTRASKSIVWTNTGANAVTVYVWDGDETPAAITTAKNGARTIQPGRDFVWNWQAGQDGGIGFIAIGHICEAGLTTTSSWIAK